jgi:hypothetical protein
MIHKDQKFLKKRKMSCFTSITTLLENDQNPGMGIPQEDWKKPPLSQKQAAKGGYSTTDDYLTPQEGIRFTMEKRLKALANSRALQP